MPLWTGLRKLGKSAKDGAARIWISFPRLGSP